MPAGSPAFVPAHLRRTILRMAYRGSTVHIACAFSLVEILAVLYRNHLKLGDQPDDPQRDYLILSKGHGVMAQYACLLEKGWLSEDKIEAYCSDGTELKGLSETGVPGLEVNSGSLGHGLAVGAGLALGALRRGTAQRVYAIVGDGECNEGSIWETLLFAAHFRLTNLLVIVDANGYQAMGRTVEILNTESLEEKFKAFGFEARTVDGHNEAVLDKTISELVGSLFSGPRAIIARTFKGKGISFMENSNLWHYSRLTEETYKAGLIELDNLNPGEPSII
ncbi:MAG TPA: transketolase [Candidatus Methylacidiphilales bacterium]|nr:transketolase [Candidatus Methylacidiphilales bacterium]